MNFGKSFVYGFKKENLNYFFVIDLNYFCLYVLYASMVMRASSRMRSRSNALQKTNKNNCSKKTTTKRLHVF